MSKVNALLKKFEQVIREPWTSSLSGQEKVWFLVFDPAELRRLEFNLGEFEIVARNNGKQWHLVSLKHAFTDWMARHEYREAYFQDPQYIKDALEGEFKAYVLKQVQEHLEMRNNENTLVVLKDVAAIFGFIKLSEVVNAISKQIKGRLLVLFPGELNNNQYRLMDARDGWDYLARPITV